MPVLIAYLAVLGLQDPPIPVAHYRPPQNGIVDSHYECGTEVRFRLQITNGSARVVDYTGATGPVPADQIAQLNDWLSPVTRYHSHLFRCQGTNENLTIEGADARTGLPFSVSVYWVDGRFGRYPDPYQLERERGQFGAAVGSGLSATDE